MSANNYQFIQTRDLFRDYLSGYPKNPTFEQWNNAPEDDKAALLFVTFYQEVTLAWNNAVVANNIVYVSQEDGVSTVIQYLMKNVEKISNDPKRYTRGYIYTVCKQCLLNLWKTRGGEQLRCANEISNEYTEGDVLVNLWDLVPTEDEDFETKQTKEAVWNVIRHMGPKAEKVVNHIINPKDTLHRVSRNTSEGKTDRLADVSVTKAEFDAIVAELRVALEPYKELLLTL